MQSVCITPHSRLTLHPAPCVNRDLPALIDMVSAGTLMAFAVVALALIWKRYTDVGQQRRKSWKALLLMGLITACCIGEPPGNKPSLLHGCLQVPAALKQYTSTCNHLCHRHNAPAGPLPTF